MIPPGYPRATCDGTPSAAGGRAYDQPMPARRAAADPRFLQVQTTTDSRAEAVELAQAAVQARLAACAQVAGPIASTYWWEEGIERAEEWLVMLKLPADRYDDLAAFLTDRHSYDEPEIIAVPIIAGSPGYLDWVEDETRPR
jgi:periplasmic divalent cation tolerance protein